MDQLKQLANNLPPKQWIKILTVAAAVVAGLIAFSRWRRESDFRPLYTSLAAEDAGAVVEKLKQSGVEYRLSETGGTGLVASSKVAGVGPPAGGAGTAPR